MGFLSMDVLSHGGFVHGCFVPWGFCPWMFCPLGVLSMDVLSPAFSVTWWSQIIMFINKYWFYSAFSVASAVDEVPDLLGSVTSPEPTQPEEEEEQETQPVRKKGTGKQKDGATKKTWTLDENIEQNLVEWLQGHSYLWLRSTRDYHKKKDAWQRKAKEIGVSYQHLTHWWKNIKDWYVKLCKKTSGQAT